MTVSSTKKFCKKDYDFDDSRAKKLAIEFIKSHYLDRWQPFGEEDEFYKDFDVVFQDKNGSMVSLEVEVKHCWRKKDRWQGYPTFDIPFRKKDSKADMYICFNDSLNMFMMARMNRILGSPVITKNTRHRDGRELTRNEKFFALDIYACRFFKLDPIGIFTEVSP